MILSSFSDVSAATQVIEADGEYILGDGENVLVAKERAKEVAIRNASMKGATFVSSVLQSVDNVLTKDEITLVTSSILEVQNSKFKNDTTSDAESIIIRCHVVVLVDTDKVEDQLGDKTKLNKLIQDKKIVEDERDRLQKENEKLRRALKQATTTSEQNEVVEKIKQNEDDFTATQYFERGSNYKRENKLSEAISEYTKAIDLNPNLAEAYEERGHSHFYLREYSEAIQDLTKAINSGIEYEIMYDNRGKSYIKLGKYNEAIKDFTKVIKEFNSLSFVTKEAYEYRGNLYVALGKYDLALSDYEKAGKSWRNPITELKEANDKIKEEPNSGFWYQTRGEVYAEIWKYDQAIADFNKAIELNHGYINLAYYKRGKVYDDLGKYDQAIADYTKAIELQPKTDSWYWFRGKLYDSISMKKHWLIIKNELNLSHHLQVIEVTLKEYKEN